MSVPSPSSSSTTSCAPSRSDDDGLAAVGTGDHVPASVDVCFDEANAALPATLMPPQDVEHVSSCDEKKLVHSTEAAEDDFPLLRRRSDLAAHRERLGRNVDLATSSSIEVQQLPFELPPPPSHSRDLRVGTSSAEELSCTALKSTTSAMPTNVVRCAGLREGSNIMWSPTGSSKSALHVEPTADVQRRTPPRGREEDPTPQSSHDAACLQQRPAERLAVSPTEDTPNDHIMDEHIQHLYSMHSAREDRRFASEAEFARAVEHKVQETISKLDAGESYEQTPLTEAIIRRHLEKQRRVDADALALSSAAPIGNGIPPHVQLSQEQRTLLKVAGYMHDFLPHLAMGPGTWYPEGDLQFDCESDGGCHNRHHCAARPRSSADEDELSFDRPPSVNDVGGIRPYRPAAPAANSTSEGGAVEIAPPPSQGPKLQTMLWRGYRAGRPFLWWCLVFPLVVCIVIGAIFRFAGGPVCGGYCSCNMRDQLQYLFTYGLAVRVLPSAVFFPYLLHIMVYAHHRTLLEQGDASGANADTAAGARMMMSLTPAPRRRGMATQQDGNGRAAGHSKQKVVEGTMPHKDVIDALRAVGGTACPNSCAVPWDVPSLKFCVQQRTFIGCAAAMTILMSLTQFAGLVGFPAITVVPIEAAAVFLPTIATCFILRVPKAVWPMVVLEAVPYVSYFAEPRLSLSYQVFQLLWPFLVVLVERITFYLFAAAALPSLPIGARVAATTMISFMSHVLIMTSALFAPIRAPILVGVATQVFLYELLLGTLVLDRLWMLVKAQWQFHVRGTKPQHRPLAASDLRCISTQTRWCSQLMAMFAIIPVRIWQRWPRVVEGGLSCEFGRIEESEFYPVSLTVVIGAFLVAGFTTGLIRRANGCLRAPLMVRGLGFPISMGLYLFTTAVLGLTAGTYGISL